MTTNNIHTEIINPDAGRVAMGMLRDTGYSFKAAIADIVDNCIDAVATDIFISSDISPDGKITISIADNGKGMDRDTLKDALKLGSTADEERKDRLGKFGVGLKTASFSFCKKLTVISKVKESDKYSMAYWDLDEIKQSGEWLSFWPTPTQKDLEPFKVFQEGTNQGTLIVWDNVDRLIRSDYAMPGGEHAKKAFDKKCQEAIRHLSLVFGRFINKKDKRAFDINIYWDKKEIPHFDPFLQDTGDARPQGAKDIPVKLRNSRLQKGDAPYLTSFYYAGYVLNRPDDEMSKDVKKIFLEQASDLGGRGQAQGIYVYRENRMIQHGGWFKAFKIEVHYTLARAEISYDNTLDEAFSLDVKKSAIDISINPAIFDELKDRLEPVRKVAENKYRDNQKSKDAANLPDRHGPGNSNITNVISENPSIVTSTITIKNPDTGDISVKNPTGSTNMTIEVISSEKEFNVKAVENISSGDLWELSADMDGKTVVNINRNHPFYSRIYGSIKSVQGNLGLDALFWVLGQLEYETVNDSDNTKKFWKHVRALGSSKLRYLTQELEWIEEPES